MESQYKHSTNGQSVIQEDLNLLGETGALADDRIFAEILRMTPYNGSTVSRGVMPPTDRFLIAGNGATGSVLVNPFRAFIGSRTAVATSAKKNLRDIRSAIAVGSTTLGQTVSLSANSSGNPRWDLIYAAVAVDANASTVTRKVKDPTTKVITSQSVVVTTQTTVTLGVTQGTAAASPVWPATPSDSGSTYYIALGYVRVPNGFGASSTVGELDIAEQAPTLALPGGSLAATTNSTVTTTQQQTWGASGGATGRPKIWLPPTIAAGAFDLLVALNLTTGSESHTNGATIDSRTFFRNRICRWVVAVGTVDVLSYLYDADGSDSTTSQLVNHGLGLSSQISEPNVARVNGSHMGLMADGTEVRLYVPSDGTLKVGITGAPNCRLFFWLQFSGVFNNCED